MKMHKRLLSYKNLIKNYIFLSLLNKCMFYETVTRDRKVLKCLFLYHLIIQWKKLEAHFFRDKKNVL